MDPKQARDKAIADCCSALFLTNPEVDRATVMTAKGKRVSGTCEWIRDEPNYQQWLEGNIPLLWIRGGPGKGKTMLSVFLVEELRKKQTVISYFCTNEDEKRNTASAVLRSLLWQITGIHPDLAQHFLTHLGAGESDVARRIEASMSSVETLWMTFTTICRDLRLSRLAFILDGLDECDQKSRDWLASKLYDLGTDSDAQNIHPPKIIIVSRDIPRLRLCRKLRLDPDDDGKIGKDVQSFVAARVQEVWALGDFDERHRQHVESTLLERSEGTFLWVGFAVAELLRKQTVLEVEQCLDELLVGLPAFYGRMFRHIATQSNTEKIAKLLQWTMLSARPLFLSELAAAIPCKATRLRSAEEVVRDLATLCRPFLVIQPEYYRWYPLEQVFVKAEGRSENQTVSLIHQSARDFMDSHEMPPAFRFQHDKVHFEIAWRCMDLIRSGADTGKNNPMLAYALNYWPTHTAKASLLGEALVEHPSEFFAESSRVRSWWLSQMADQVNISLGDSFPPITQDLSGDPVTLLRKYMRHIPWVERVRISNFVRRSPDIL